MRGRELASTQRMLCKKQKQAMSDQVVQKNTTQIFYSIFGLRCVLCALRLGGGEGLFQDSGAMVGKERE